MGKRRRSEHRFDELATIGASLVGEAQRLAKRYERRRRARRSRAGRIMRAVLWALFATIAFVPLMIAGGIGLGARALIALPILLVGVYGTLLYYALKRPTPLALPAPSATVSSPEGIALLPAQTSDWLELERDRLPYAAQSKLDSIGDRLEQLQPQVAKLPADAASAHEMRRLLGEELPQLIEGYHKVPRALTTQPLYGGSTPERQLIEGLETIDAQIVRLHEQLARDDLHALATHQRYLDMKYNRKDDIE